MAEVRKRVGKDGDVSFLISVYLGRDESTGKKLYERTTYHPEATTAKAMKKEADRFADDFQKRVEDGDLLDGEKITLREFVKIWEKNVLSDKSPKRQEGYLHELNNFFLPAIGHMKLTKIRANHIDVVIRDRRASGRSASTVRFCFTVINSVMQYAFRKGYIRENPCLRCDDLPKDVRKEELHYFTVDQAKTFLNALTLEYPEEREDKIRKLPSGKTCTVSGYTMKHKISFQYRPYFSIAIFGGLRRGEIVALTWEDVDLDAHTISVSKSIARPKTGEYVKPPKTQSSNRAIMLPAETFDLLREWKRQQKTLCLKMGTAWKGYRGKDFDKNNVFISLDDGTRMCIDTPSHKFYEVIDLYNKHYAQREEDKLPRIRLHDLRHTSATLLLANGVDIETVSKRLGHSRASITLDIYGHALKEMDEKASDTLEKYLLLRRGNHERQTI